MLKVLLGSIVAIVVALGIIFNLASPTEEECKAAAVRQIDTYYSVHWVYNRIYPRVDSVQTQVQIRAIVNKIVRVERHLLSTDVYINDSMLNTPAERFIGSFTGTVGIMHEDHLVNAVRNFTITHRKEAIELIQKEYNQNKK